MGSKQINILRMIQAHGVGFGIILLLLGSVVNAKVPIYLVDLSRYSTGQFVEEEDIASVVCAEIVVGFDEGYIMWMYACRYELMDLMYDFMLCRNVTCWLPGLSFPRGGFRFHP